MTDKLQKWSKLDKSMYLNIHEKNVLMQYFNCDQMKIIKAIGVGCYINHQEKMIVSLIQIQLIGDNQAKNYENLLKDNRSEIFSNKCFSCKIILEKNIISFFYDDQAWTLSVVALLANIEFINLQYHMMFVHQLNQLTNQIQQDANLFIVNEVNTNFWKTNKAITRAATQQSSQQSSATDDQQTLTSQVAYNELVNGKNGTTEILKNYGIFLNELQERIAQGLIDGENVDNLQAISQKYSDAYFNLLKSIKLKPDKNKNNKSNPSSYFHQQNSGTDKCDVMTEIELLDVKVKPN